MIIHIKNKNTLIIDDFIFKCCIGKKGFNLNKIEGDNSTPKGLFKLKKLYFRKDRVGEPICKLSKKKLLKTLPGAIILLTKNIMKKFIHQIKIQKNYFLGMIINMII